MKKVTKSEYFARFMHLDAVCSIPETGTVEWCLRNSRVVIARSVDVDDLEAEYFVLEEKSK